LRRIVGFFIVSSSSSWMPKGAVCFRVTSVCPAFPFRPAFPPYLPRALFILSVVGYTKTLLPTSLPGGPNES
jgi:hypothetical protein